jgi:hypothetical protein
VKGGAPSGQAWLPRSLNKCVTTGAGENLRRPLHHTAAWRLFEAGRNAL